MGGKVKIEEQKCTLSVQFLTQSGATSEKIGEGCGKGLEI